MQYAQQRDALRHQKFHFRKCLSTSTSCYVFEYFSIIFLLYSAQTPDTPSLSSIQQDQSQENECQQRSMTINEIINGSVRNPFSFFFVSFYLMILLF